MRHQCTVEQYVGACYYARELSYWSIEEAFYEREASFALHLCSKVYVSR